MIERFELGDREALVSAHCDGAKEPMLPWQREKLIDEMVSECDYSLEELEAMTDQDLARAVYRSWSDYVNCTF